MLFFLEREELSIRKSSQESFVNIRRSKSKLFQKKLWWTDLIITYLWNNEHLGQLKKKHLGAYLGNILSQVNGIRRLNKRLKVL